MSFKNLVNNSDSDLNVALLVRKGQQPGTNLATVRVAVPAGQTVRAQYGDESNPYLDGVNIRWIVSGTTANQRQVVTRRGSAWDDILNTHDTLTFSAPTPPAILGSNG